MRHRLGGDGDHPVIDASNPDLGMRCDAITYGKGWCGVPASRYSTRSCDKGPKLDESASWPHRRIVHH